MLTKFIFLISIYVTAFSQPMCKEGVNNCAKCNYLTKLCSKCEKSSLYFPDDKGGCKPVKKCTIGHNYCNECSENGEKCQICVEGYFPDENGGCSYTVNCAISEKGECIECISNYILIGKSFFSDYNLKMCKSLNSEDFKNCDEINEEKGVCSKCKEDYFLNTGDYRCIKTQNCLESIYEICIKCINGYYYNRKENECKKKDSNFLYCKETIDGTTCEICEDGYYFAEDGKCTNVNYCSETNDYNKCAKCISNYYLSSSSYYSSCTITDHCLTGDSDMGICFSCDKNYYIDYKDGKCKPNNEDNEFKYCRTANGECLECIFGYFIGDDSKCSSTKNCSESNLGICAVCSDNFYLGKDNICSDVEHCIYSNRNFECTECEGDYYYNILNKKCIIGENNYANCKITNYQRNFCDKCKSNYCMNQTEHTCFSNEEVGDFYKCAMTDPLGRFCVSCEDDYYLGAKTRLCSIINGCERAEMDDSRCIECNYYYCLDLKTGKCKDNDVIEDEEKKYYFRCNRTNKEGTACEICMEDFSLTEDGLCVDMEKCEEKKDDGTCQKCLNDEETYYFYCANEIFGCVETYEHNCLECNDILELNKCTKCVEGYELNEENECVEIIDN